MKFIASSLAAPAVGPYTPAVLAGNLLFVSGQIPVLPDGSLAAGDIESQTRRALANLNLVIEAAGASLAQVAKTTVFLADLEEFAGMNRVYSEFFGDHRPARSTVQVARLPRDARVEIEAVVCIA